MVALDIVTVVPHLLPVLLELSRIGSPTLIMLELLPVLTKGPLVLPHLLTVCSHVAAVLPKIAAVSLTILPILAEIPSIFSHVLATLAWPSVRGAGLGIDGTAAHDGR